MMEDNVALYYAKMLFLRSGYCKHSIEFRVTSEIPGTNITLTNCSVCNKEYDRTYNAKA